MVLRRDLKRTYLHEEENGSFLAGAFQLLPISPQNVLSRSKSTPASLETVGVCGTVGQAPRSFKQA